MKLKSILNLNTIIILLSIIVFSVIFYLYFQSKPIIEGLQTLEELKTEYNSLYANEQAYKTCIDAYTQKNNAYVAKKNEYDTKNFQYNQAQQQNTAVPINIISIPPILKDLSDELSAKLNDMEQTLFQYKTSLNLHPADKFAENNIKLNSAKSNIGLSTKLEAIRNGLNFTHTILPGDSKAIISIANSSPANYNITATYDNNKTITKTQISSSAFPYTFDSLVNDKQYKFTIVANYGNLNDGNVLILEKTTHNVIPRAMPSLEVTVYVTTASVKIIPPSGTAPTKYTISVVPSPNVVIPTTTSLTRTITGLTPNTTYTFTVTSVYSDGSTIQSNEVQKTPRDEPSATITPGDKSATITISGSPQNINSYDITASGVSSSKTNVSVGQHLFTNLSNGTSYTFTVTAKYTDNTITTKTLTVTPVLPTPSISITSVTRKTNKKFGIQFTTNPGATKYVIQYNRDGYATSEFNVSSTIPFDIPVLASNKNYRFRVKTTYTNNTTTTGPYTAYYMSRP